METYVPFPLYPTTIFFSDTYASHFYSIPGISTFPPSLPEVTLDYWPAEDIPNFLQGTVPLYEHLLAPPPPTDSTPIQTGLHIIWHQKKH